MDLGKKELFLKKSVAFRKHQDTRTPNTQTFSLSLSYFHENMREKEEVHHACIRAPRQSLAYAHPVIGTRHRTRCCCRRRTCFRAPRQRPSSRPCLRRPRRYTLYSSPSPPSPNRIVDIARRGAYRKRLGYASGVCSCIPTLLSLI